MGVLVTFSGGGLKNLLWFNTIHNKNKELLSIGWLGLDRKELLGINKTSDRKTWYCHYYR